MSAADPLPPMQPPIGPASDLTADEQVDALRQEGEFGPGVADNHDVQVLGGTAAVATLAAGLFAGAAAAVTCGATALAMIAVAMAAAKNNLSEANVSQANVDGFTAKPPAEGESREFSVNKSDPSPLEKMSEGLSDSCKGVGAKIVELGKMMGNKDAGSRELYREIQRDLTGLKHSEEIPPGSKDRELLYGMLDEIGDAGRGDPTVLDDLLGYSSGSDIDD